MKRLVSIAMLTLLLTSMVTLTLNIRPVMASGTTCIRADGGMDPLTTPRQGDFMFASSGPPATQLNKTYGGANNDWGFSVMQTDDGGYALAGSTYSYGHGQWDFWLVKTGANGNTEWSKTYGGTSDDTAWSAIKTLDGGYALAGHSDSFSSDWQGDAWLVKTDATGNVVWNKTYGGGGNDIVLSIVQIDDGGYACAGYIGGPPYADLWLFVTNATGDLVWSRTYGGVDDEAAWSIIKTTDGGYAAAGYTASFGCGSRDVWLVKTDVVGNVQWNKTYGGTSMDQGFSIVQTEDGGYAFVARTYSFGSGDADIWLVKTDAVGNEQWNETYGGAAEDWSWSIIQTDDGGYMVPGLTRSFGAGGQDSWLVRTDAAGDVQWDETYGGTAEDRANSAVQTVDRGYAVIGYTYSFGSGGADFWLIKLAPEAHDVAISDVSPSRAVVGQGHSLPINVTVKNEGNFAETFNVTVYANTTQIGMQTVTGLDSGANKILAFSWNTTGIQIGNYTIGAVAETVTNETDTLDNTYVDGTVTVRLPIHDVAVSYVASSEAVVIQGYSLDINATATNTGDYAETFNVTAYANTTVIGQTEVTLTEGNSVTITFFWNTTSLACGNYTISGYATPVLDEAETVDNTYIDGIVTVRLPIRDVAVLDVAPASDVVLRGLNLNINGTVENQGELTETFNVTAYANATVIDEKEVTVDSGESAIVVFVWNTTEFSIANYTISVNATIVSEEADVNDNTCANGVVTVRGPGDIAVVGVTPFKTVVGLGYTMSINVTVENQGDYLETFNVTAYSNTNEIDTFADAILTSGNSTTITLVWNTSGLAYGNYTMRANATLVPDETDIGDNFLTDGKVYVGIPGDVNGDGVVNILDSIILGNSFLATPSSSSWNPNADINDDKVVNILDSIIVGNHFLEHYP